MMMDILVPLGAFAMFALVMGQLGRLFSNLSLNRTLREALRSNPDSVPILAERLDARQPWADALIGWVFIALAVGLALMALFEERYEQQQILQGAIVPLVIGATVIAYVRWAKKAG